MAASKKDPTEAMRLKASRYPGVDQGTACTQSSFRTGKKAFLFVGTQGGRHKAMFKLSQSLPEAAKLAKSDPDSYGAGSTGRVTARFTAESPMPKKLWEKWLQESYELSLASGTRKPATKQKATKKKAPVSKVTRKAKPKKKA